MSKIKFNGLNFHTWETWEFLTGEKSYPTSSWAISFLSTKI